MRSGRASAAADACRATPLHWAAYKGRTATTAALLGAGADPSIKECNGYAASLRAPPHGQPLQPRPRFRIYIYIYIYLSISIDR